MSDTAETVATADMLRALDLPAEALAPFLAHIEAFCRAHGGELRYGELLALVARCRDALPA